MMMVVVVMVGMVTTTTAAGGWAVCTTPAAAVLRLLWVVGVRVVLLHACHATARRAFHVVGHFCQAFKRIFAPHTREHIACLFARSINPLCLPRILTTTARLGAHRLRSSRRWLVIVMPCRETSC